MKFRPIVTQQEIDQVNKLALEDGHPMFAPTMSIRDDKEQLVGAFTIMPMSVVWTHSQLPARKTKEVVDFLEGNMSTQARIFCVPVVEKSRLFPFVPKYGYIDLGSAHLFVKGLL